MQLHHDRSDPALLFDTLVDSDNTSYLLSSHLELVRANTGWERFARENDGERVRDWYPGRQILEGISEVLRPFYATNYMRVLWTGVRWEHDYECSSALDYRVFRMMVLPSDGMLVVTHSPLVEVPHTREASPPRPDYVWGDAIVMCSNCRRVLNARHPKRWDWVPAFVADLPQNVTNGLCPPCARYYPPG
ncbi:MAG: hypothetical protein H0T79_08170 [Deltaproteobacteria bacterium]|nr:hypothetical protein [Deltaproteobacteria bacterium]